MSADDIKPATGKTLDNLAALYGLRRRWYDFGTDWLFRRRLVIYVYKFHQREH